MLPLASISHQLERDAMDWKRGECAQTIRNSGTLCNHHHSGLGGERGDGERIADDDIADVAYHKEERDSIIEKSIWLAAL